MNLNPSIDPKGEKSYAPPPSYGAASASAPAPYTPFRTAFAAISLNSYDKLRLLNFPPEETAQIRNVIRQSWPRGIQKEQPYGPSYEFKLGGYPWQGYETEGIQSRILMREILAHLYSIGWVLHASTDCSKKEFDKDTLFFRKQSILPPPSTWLAISFNKSDRLRTIGAPPDLRAEFKGVLHSMNLLQTDLGWKDKNLGAWEFKINGYPWYATGKETMSTRLLILRLLECLERTGWSLYASIDQNTGSSEHSSETDTWFCLRDKNWVSGAPVFHR